MRRLAPILVAAVLAAAFAGVGTAGSGAPRAAVQVSVGSPYLDIVARYQSGDQPKAVADMAAYPTSGLRDRARKDLRDLTCQVLCGIADCRRARAEKPEEFARVLEAWGASMRRPRRCTSTPRSGAVRGSPRRRRGASPEIALELSI